MSLPIVNAVTAVVATSATAVTRFIGFSVFEDAGAAAQWTLSLGGGATNQDLIRLRLAANESATVMFPLPISTPEGVYVTEDSGSITGVLFTVGAVS